MNWDLGNDNFLDSLLKMENLNDSEPFEFLSSNDDFMSSAATTPRSYDNAESSSCSDSGTVFEHFLYTAPACVCMPNHPDICYAYPHRTNDWMVFYYPPIDFLH